MHELGVVFYIIDDVEKIAKENQVSKVSSVTLELGEVSGVLPDYLTDCFNWAVKKHPVMEECKLIIETIPAITYCEDCEKVYDTVPQGKICPHCGSKNTYLKQGNEFMIKEISVVDNERDGEVVEASTPSEGQ